MADGAFGRRTLAFEDLYQRHREHVRSALRQHHVPAADLEDLQQEVFLVLLRKLEGRVDRDRLRAWLFQVARRVASNHRRGLRRLERKRTNAWRELPRDCPEEQLRRKEGLALLEQFVESMEPMTARVFLMAEVEGLRGAEIAAALDVPVHVVYPRLRKARRSFARFVRRRTQSGLRSFVPAWWGRVWISIRRALSVELAPLAPAVLVMVWFATPAPVQGLELELAETAPVFARDRVQIPDAVVVAAAKPDAPAPHRSAKRRRGSVPVNESLAVVAPEPVDAVAHLAPLLDPELPSPPPLQTTVPAVDGLRGTVVDEKGRALAHARVYCRRVDGLRRRPCARASTLTDRQGRFELGQLGQGEYQLVAFRAGTNVTAADEVVVAWGDEAPRSVEIRAE